MPGRGWAGSRLGGNTGQMFLRFVGWDGFVTSRDMVARLRDAGLDKSEEAKSKSDLAKVHATTVEPVRTAHAACKTGLLRRLRFLR
jgi:hypothetical protein